MNDKQGQCDLQVHVQMKSRPDKPLLHPDYCFSIVFYTNWDNCSAMKFIVNKTLKAKHKKKTKQTNPLRFHRCLGCSYQLLDRRHPHIAP